MLKDKVIAITGATGSIGSALAKGVIDNGGKVIIGDVSKSKGMQLQEKLGKRTVHSFM